MLHGHLPPDEHLKHSVSNSIPSLPSINTSSNLPNKSNQYQIIQTLKSLLQQTQNKHHSHKHRRNGPSINQQRLQHPQPQRGGIFDPKVIQVHDSIRLPNGQGAPRQRERRLPDLLRTQRVSVEEDIRCQQRELDLGG